MIWQCEATFGHDWQVLPIDLQPLSLVLAKVARLIGSPIRHQVLIVPEIFLERRRHKLAPGCRSPIRVGLLDVILELKIVLL